MRLTWVLVLVFGFQPPPLGGGRQLVVVDPRHGVATSDSVNQIPVIFFVKMGFCGCERFQSLLNERPVKK